MNYFNVRIDSNKNLKNKKMKNVQARDAYLYQKCKTNYWKKFHKISFQNE